MSNNDEVFVLYKKSGGRDYAEFFDNNDLNNREGIVVKSREIAFQKQTKK